MELIIIGDTNQTKVDTGNMIVVLLTKPLIRHDFDEGIARARTFQPDAESPHAIVQDNGCCLCTNKYLNGSRQLNWL